MIDQISTSAHFWALLAALSVITYVCLDGFDLGVGILFCIEKNPEHRNLMVSTVAPLWDGNETWMVLGASLLYSAFPKAYSQLLTMLYMPILIMLCGLIFRGVAFEFRAKAERSLSFWNSAFFFHQH